MTAIPAPAPISPPPSTIHSARGIPGDLEPDDVGGKELPQASEGNVTQPELDAT